jgi:hypothetical protein
MFSMNAVRMPSALEDGRPRAVALGEAVVRRHEMHAVAGERVEI